MPRARRGSNGRGLALALALCAGLTLVHRQRSHSDPVLGAVRDAALVPTQTALFGLDHWWRGHVTALFRGPRLARDNARLQAEAGALRAQNADLLAAQAENTRLRLALGFQKRAAHPLLAAEVVALKPTPLTDTLILSRGTRDGVHPQEVVLGPDGALVGQVLDVSARACTVLLLTDAGSSAGAEVVRPVAPGKTSPPKNSPQGVSPAAPVAAHQAAPGIGICQGDRAGHLLLTFPRIDADVRPGDRVVTSGLGTIFPQGLPLGTVVFVSTDKTRAVKTATLRPAADFDHLEQVFLSP